MPREDFYFEESVTARWVELAPLDNFFGRVQPSTGLEFGGGDRVGLGELRFHGLSADLNEDGEVGLADMTLCQVIPDRDEILHQLNTLPGDLDGKGEVSFKDFLVLSDNFGKDLHGESRAIPLEGA